MHRIFLLSVITILGALPAFAQTIHDDGDTKGAVQLQRAGVVVPNVVGKAYRDAIAILQGAGLNATANGNYKLSQKVKMTVTRQTPAAGSRAPKNTMVVVDLR